MFDSRLETFLQINDSLSSFESSFEIKNIQSNNENILTECYSRKPINSKYIASFIRQLDKIPANNHLNYSPQNCLSGENFQINSEESPHSLKLNTEAINQTYHTSNMNINESIISNTSCEFNLQIHPPLLPSYRMTPTKQNNGIWLNFTKAKGHGLICSSKAKLTSIPKIRYSSSSIRSSMRSNSRFDRSIRFNSMRKANAIPTNNRSVFNDITNSDSRQLHTSFRNSSSCNVCEIANYPHKQRHQEISSKKYCAKASLISMTTATANPSDITNCNSKQALIDNLTDVFKANHLLSDRGTVKKVTSVAAWTTSFEHLLDDDVGYKLFAEFLKLEYSAENIYFWAAVERYRKLENKAERIIQAEQIVRKHLAIGALEPVNVDSQARNINDEALRNASRDLFNAAQKQVFHLMKFDSYPRFTRSDLYKTCLKAEEDHQPLPYSNQPLDELLKRNISSIYPSKLKKSASNAEERRGKGLLPWNRKTRSKSRDRINESVRYTSSRNNSNIAQSTQLKQQSKIPIIINNSFKSPQITRPNSISNVRNLRSSISSFDNLPMNGLNVTPSLCRIKFPDGATTMVQTKFTENIGELMQRLMEKRGIVYSHYDVIIKGSNKSAELQAYTQDLAGKEVSIEQRIAFKMDLPDRKVIAVKSKPKKQLIDVIKPILNKYNYTLETVEVLKSNTQEAIDLDQPVTTVEGLRLQAVPRKAISIFNAAVDDYHNETVASNADSRQSYKVEIQNLQGHCKSTDDITSKWIRKNGLNKTNEGSVAISLNLEKKLNSIPSPENVTKKKSSCISIPTKSFIYLNKSNSPKRILEHKKPIIAKLKTGAKVHLAETPSENTDDFCETGKIVHLARSECHKISENSNEANELPSKMPVCIKDDLNRLLLEARANLCPVNTSENFTHSPEKNTHRLSLPTKDKANNAFEEVKHSNHDNDLDAVNKGPPPLPPKPKILPIKPSNWGINNINNFVVEPQTNSSYSLHPKFRNSMRDSPKIKSENNKSISV